MKPKSITKKAKRPKSVLKKAWETRRKNAAHRASLPGQIAETLYGDKQPNLSAQGLASLVQGMQQTSETAIHRSEVDSIVSNARYEGAIEGRKDHKQETDETALCGMVAMYRLWDRTNVKPAHAPYMISGITAKAIVEKLESLGYTADGKKVEGWQVVCR